MRNFKKNIIYKLLILLLVIINSCQHKENKYKKYEQKINFNSLVSISADSSDDITNKSGRFFSLTVVDTFLVCVNYFDKKVLYIANSKTHKYLGSIISRGKNYGECLSISAIMPIKKSEFLAYDVTLNKILRIDIAKAMSDYEYEPVEESVLNEPVLGLKSPVRINENLFAACSYFNDSSRYLVFDKKSKVYQHVGELPALKDEWPQKNPRNTFSLKAMVYSANLVKHPTKDSVLVFYNRMDRIDSYINNKLKKIIIGPNTHEPIYDFVTSSSGITIPHANKETWYTYVQVSSCRKYAITLYSGKNSDQMSSSLILLFNWSGKPLIKINLAEQVDCIAADISEEEIKGFFAINQQGRIVYIPIKVPSP